MKISKKTSFYLLSIAIPAVLILLFAESIVRFYGYRPWSGKEIKNTVIVPGGKRFNKHPTLGYTFIPGEFRLMLPSLYSYKYTILSNSLRVTHPLDTYNSENQKDEIWIFGGSFAWGEMLNDEESFPWLLQNKFQQYEIVNFGVSGYGNLQSLIQFEEAIKKRKRAKYAIITYASSHDFINTFSRSWKKEFFPNNYLEDVLLPYARINKDGKLIYGMGKGVYHEFPMMRYSAFMHYLEKQYNRFQDRFYHNHEVSKAIIKKFSDLAKKNNIKLIVAGIKYDSTTYEMLEYARNQGIMATDISVDLSIWKNNNLPYDIHPSAIANKYYAEKLEYFLKVSGASQSQVEDLPFPEIQPFFSAGWSLGEVLHHWSIAKRATIEFQNDQKENRKALISFSLVTLKEKQMSIFFNSNLLTTLKLTPGKGLDIAPQILMMKPGKNILQFETDIPPETPGNGDTRLLSFAIINFELVSDYSD